MTDPYRHAKNMPEDLRRLRFPPNGDVEEWVKYGPGGRDHPEDTARLRLIISHRCVADEPGADCQVCGFPWWTVDTDTLRQLGEGEHVEQYDIHRDD